MGAPQSEADIVLLTKLILNSLDHPGYHYYNPQYTVHASPETPEGEFSRVARSCRLAWLKCLKQTLFSNRGLKREMRRTDPIIRQLEFTGVLIVGSRHRSNQLA